MAGVVLLALIAGAAVFIADCLNKLSRAVRMPA